MTHPEASNRPIEDERIRKALALEESEELDFKRLKGKCVDSVAKAACAMANGNGGWLVLGIDDPVKHKGRDRVFGIEENPEALGDIRRAFQSAIQPPLRLPHTKPPAEFLIRCTLHNGSIGQVALIRIFPSETVHNLVNGGTYLRFGSQSRQLSALEITELSLTRGVTSILETTVDVPFELLDTEYWRMFKQHRQLSRPLDDALRHLGLAREESGGVWRPTRAAVLLFAENPSGLLSRKCSVRIFHYRGHQIEFSKDTNLLRHPQTFDGPVYYQIREAAKAVSTALSHGVHVSAGGFEIRQTFPERVITEAITNAIIHRDYYIDQDIHIRIFANRIEVESPGLFPGRITPANIHRSRSHPRNRILVDRLRDFPFPPNLDAGEGVRMMYATLKQGGLYPPIYRSQEELDRPVVQVDLLNEERLSEWELVQDFLADHDSVSNADVRRITNQRDTGKVSRLLREWVDRGLLELIDPSVGNKSRRYTLRNRSEDSQVSGDVESAVSRILFADIENK